MLQQNLSRVITQLRFRVQNHGDYLSSVDEARTRYTLIDPILRALGWDLADPSQVKVEIDIDMLSAVKKADYALFKKSGSGERLGYWWKPSDWIRDRLKDSDICNLSSTTNWQALGRHLTP